MFNGRFVTFAVAVCAVLVPAARAELSGKDRDRAKQMTQGKLYLTTTLPMRYTSGGWGIGSEVLSEVSPVGIDIEKNMPAPGDKKRRGVDTIYWGFGPNDAIQNGSLYYKKDNIIDLWAEGVEKSKNVEVTIRFVGIKTLDDFQKAFDLVLSPKSVPDQHPDWPEEVRKAIVDRKVIVGMTKEQAFAVVGIPVGLEKGEDAGKTIETWMPRQDTGALGSFGKVLSSTTGFPVSIRFVDGKVAGIGQPGGKVVLDLKK
jgi:hypothetical protein